VRQRRRLPRRAAQGDDDEGDERRGEAEEGPTSVFGTYSSVLSAPKNVGVSTNSVRRTTRPATIAATAASVVARPGHQCPMTNGTSRQASSRSNARLSRMPVCGTRSAMRIEMITIGSIIARTARSSGSVRVEPLPSEGSRIPRMLRTATDAVPRITPFAVEHDAATMAESTRTASQIGANCPSRVNSTGVWAVGPSAAPTARATSA